MCTIADYLRDCRLFARLQIFCVFADFLCDCRFLDLVLFLPRNLQDLWRIGGFLEDLWIICTIVDNFYDCRLLEQSQIARAIVDYLHNFTDILRD